MILRTATELVLVALLTSFGCRGPNQPVKTPEGPPPLATEVAPSPSSSSAPPPAVAPASSATSPDAALPAPSAANDTPPAQPLLSDPQILQVVHTANQGEIAQAKLARSKTKDARVKKLAAMMLSDHSEADHKTAALARKGGGMAPSATSTSLANDAQNATTTLDSESGSDFDKGYVDTQVKEHQAVLDLIDQQLLPNAKDAAVRTFMTSVRAKVAMHLHHAQQLQGALAK